MWIESHQELARHPKTKRLARVAGVGIPAAIGHLHLLWWWAVDYAQDGDLSKYDAGDIADATCWEGDPEVLFKALVESGFIDSWDGKTIIHDWYCYAGKRIEQLKKDAERKRNAKNQAFSREQSGGEPPENKGGEQSGNQKGGKPPSSTPYTPPFEEFWLAYPRKDDKGQAYKKYAARLKDGYTEAELLSAAKAYSDKCRREKTEQKYIKQGKTFLGDSTPFRDFLPKQEDTPQETVDPFEQAAREWEEAKIGGDTG